MGLQKISLGRCRGSWIISGFLSFTTKCRVPLIYYHIKQINQQFIVS